MNRIRATTVLAMLGLGPLALAADPPASDVDALVRREMARQRIPGLSLGVVREGHLVRAEGYGLASVERVLQPRGIGSGRGRPRRGRAVCTHPGRPVTGAGALTRGPGPAARALPHPRPLEGLENAA